MKERIEETFKQIVYFQHLFVATIISLPIFSGQSLLYPVDDEHCWSVETKEVRVNDALSILRVRNKLDLY